MGTPINGRFKKSISRIRASLLLLVLLGWQAVNSQGAEYFVTSAAEITSTLAEAQAGDTLVMHNGVWMDADILLRVSGAPERPITLRAERPGQVLLSGSSRLRIGGTNLVIDGLLFTNGYRISSDVVSFRYTSSTISQVAVNCLLTNCAIIDYNAPNSTNDTKWVSLYGYSNRVEHCYFKGKTNAGSTVVVWVDAAPNSPNYHRIEGNYFGPRPALGVNGGETIRVGSSEVSMNLSRTLVEENYFEQCSGDVEIISNKSCENTYRHNTFVDCEGTLCLRHGNRCVVDGNYFFGHGKTNTGGVRILGEDHLVYNNYFADLGGSSSRSALTISLGISNSPLNGYFQVQRATVAFNTFENCYSTLLIGLSDTYNGTASSLPPVDCVIANNLAQGGARKLIDQRVQPINLRCEGNIMYGTSLGITNSGITWADPKLVLAPDGIWRPASSSPAIGAGQGNYPFVTEDMEGQLRVGAKDVGCDQISTNPIVWPPARRIGSGPLWLQMSALGLMWNNPADIAYGTALSAAQLNATATVPGKFDYSPPLGTILNAGSQVLTVTFTPNDTTNYVIGTRTVSINVLKATPVVVWTNPASIDYGTLLGTAQLNAIADVPGQYVYSPSAGTRLNAGTGQVLSVTFTPDDLASYTPASRGVLLDVRKAAPVITWATPADITNGTQLTALQLNARANVPGTIVYEPRIGTILNVGNGQILSAIFTPQDTANYLVVTQTVTINVRNGGKITPTIQWATPLDITYETPLNEAQLNAVASVPGAFIYTPPFGAVLNSGSNQLLSATFVPADLASNTLANKTVSINVHKATPVITWPQPANIVAGTELNELQLNATVTTPGQLIYTPPPGTVLDTGNNQLLTVSFTPMDLKNHVPATNSVRISVLPPSQVMTGMVQVAYLIPSNRSPQATVITNLQTTLLVYQSWFRDQMKLNGFGAKTFSVETEADGITPKIRVVPLSETDDELRGDIYGGRIIEAAYGAGLPVGTPGQIWVLVPEVHKEGADGIINGNFRFGFSESGSGHSPGWAVVGSDTVALSGAELMTNNIGYDGQVIPEIGPYPLRYDASFPWFEGATLSSVSSSAVGAGLRALASAFGLDQDYRNDENFNGNLMGEGFRGFRGMEFPELYGFNYTRLSYGAALALNVSPYFNRGKPLTDEIKASLSTTTSGSLDPENGVLRIDFSVVDSNGLAAAFLYWKRDYDWWLVDEVKLSGFQADGAFYTPYYDPGVANEYQVSVYDRQGNKQSVSAIITPTAGFNQAPWPQLSAAPLTAGPGEEVIVDASGTYDPGRSFSMLEVEWDLDGDGIFEVPSGTSLLVTNHYDTIGNRLVRARITDPAGGQSISAPLPIGIALCETTLSPTSRPHGYGAATNKVIVTASPQCIWTASSTNNWISVLSGSNSIGGNTVVYAVQANQSWQERIGSIQIGDQYFVITQRTAGCGFALSPANRFHGYGATVNSVTVSALAGCTWEVVNTNNWITITGPTSFQGPGVVNYSISRNSSGELRMGVLSIADLPFTITQWGTNCGTVLSPPLRVHGFGAETGMVAVTVSSGCGWDTANTNEWIHLTGVTNGLGNGSVAYSLDANTTESPRAGILLIGGKVFTITQSGCSYTLSPPQMTHGFGAAFGSFNLTTVDGCLWTATSSNDWITILGTSSGFGPAEISYSVAANPYYHDRTGLISVSGVIYEITQAALPCTYELSPTSWAHSEETEVGEVLVVTGEECAWTVINTNDWVSVITPAESVGPGSVIYIVSANPGLERGGYLLIAGKFYLVDQLGGLRQGQVGTMTVATGKTNWVPVGFATHGNENSLALSLCYDATALNFVSARIGAGVKGATLYMTTNQIAAGQLGITISMPTGWAFAGATQTVVEVAFKGGAVDGTGLVPLQVCDQPVAQRLSDVSGQALPFRIGDGAVQVIGDCSLGGALTAKNLTWTLSGDALWICQTNITWDGQDAAQSGQISDSGGSSYLDTTVTGPALLTFWWKVSSEAGKDRLRFYMNGSQVTEISGEVDWQPQSYTVAAGSQTVRWRYYKNSSLSAGLDRGWVDQVKVTPLPPTITNQPVSQSVDMGSSVSFVTGVSGTPPFSYQWQWNGANLAEGPGVRGVNSATLVLSNLTTAQAGAYSVLVSNAAGVVSSAPAWLAIAPVLSLAEALDTPGWLWITSGAPSWVGQTLITRDGTNAARSGTIGNSQTNSMQTAVTGPGAISFWWKVSSETNNDRLTFFIGNTEQARISGEVDWEWRIFDVPAGSNLLTWSYSKNSGTSQRQDRAWVDQVQFGPVAPVITNQPLSQSVDQGLTATLSVGVRGTPPFTYQWQFEGDDLADGPDISGSSTATLRLTNVQPAQAGNYAVRIANALDTVTSSNAILLINPIPALAEALDTPGWTWTNTSGSNWFGQTAVAHDGVDAARSGPVGNSQSSILETTITGPGTLSFWWKVSSEVDNDYLRFYLNGSSKFSISGEVDWQWRTVNLSSGTQVVQWRYVKDSSSTAGQDRGWLDEVIFVSSSTPAAPVIAMQPLSQTVVGLTNVTFRVGALGATLIGYQWLWNGTELTNGSGISGATTTNLTLTSVQGWRAGVYSVRVTNAVGTAISSDAILSVITTPIITNQPISQTVTGGATVNLTVGAIGQPPMSYQWLFNGVRLVNSGNVSGATTATLRLSSITATQGGTYSVSISNAAGRITSDSAVVTVVTPPVITRQPVSQSVGVGATVRFSVQANSSVPLSYQWRCNGANLTDGENISASSSPTLVISNVQPSQVGAYSVVISNAVAQITSSNANLTIVTPPEISNDPLSQTVTAGSTVIFSVNSSGSTPLSYRWQLDETDLTNGGCILGANTATLTISNVQPIHAGGYSVIVSNGAGVVKSAEASLQVIAPMTLGQAVNATYLAWNTDLNSPWIPQTNITLDGIGAARTSTVGTNDCTWLETTLLGPGTISFWWKISSETNHDYLNFYVDGVERQSISGVVNWQYQSIDLTPGSHVLRWSYEKDAAVAQGQDCAWLDQVQYIPSTGPSLPAITSQPISDEVNPGGSLTFNVEASGTPPLTYQWRYNGVDLIDGPTVSGASTPSLSLSAIQPTQQGSYSVVVRNSYSLVMSDHAQLSVIVPIPLADALDTDNPIRAWNYGGASLWLGQNKVTYDHFDAAQTGSLGHNQTNWIETWVDGPCAVSFWWKVSSQTNRDYLRFYVDGVEKGNISGEVDWRWRTFTITNSLTNVSHRVRWVYSKDASGSSGLDRGWLDQVTVGPLAPTVDTQPMDVTAEPGAIAEFSIQEMASHPVDYQWRLGLTPLVDGNGIIGSTNKSLMLSNVQPAQAGTYSVMVENPGGRTLSSNATLSFFSGAPLSLALDTSGKPWNLGWISGGAAPWITQTATTYDGLDAAQSPALLDAQESWIQTYVMGPGTLKFWWSVDSELSFDRLRIYVDGMNQTSISGLVPWQQLSYTVPSGIHSFRWRYMKNGSLSSGQDRGWVDQVTFDPVLPPVITNQPQTQIVDAGATVTFTVGVTGTPPYVYIWQKNGVTLNNGGNISGATNATLRISPAQVSDSGLYTVFVTNLAATVMSVPAQLTVCPTIPLAEAVDAPEFTWSSTGDALWIGQTNVSYDRIDAARSPALGEGGSSYLQTTVDGPGIVSFWWKVSSQNASSTDRLRFYANGSSRATIYGEVDWQWVMYNVTTVGPTTLQWRYSKNSDGITGGQDRGWVDQVMFSTGPMPPMITNQPLSQIAGLGASATFSVGAVGSTPMRYQWRLNGQDLVDGPYVSGATNARLTLPELQVDQAGTYTVLVANDGGSLVSAEAVLQLITAPTITQQPSDVMVAEGATVNFSVVASGAPPLQYQWYLNGAPVQDGGTISGAQSANLILASVSPTEAGSYSVMIWNDEASALSVPAMLSVIRSIPLGIAVNATNWVWTTSGDASWIGQTNISHDGSHSAWSGAIADGQTTSLETTVDGPGTIRFWWRVSSETSNDRLRFYVDGSEAVRISGESGWLLQTSTIPAQTQVTLEWRYSKNSSLSVGEDHAWVDQVSFIPWAPVITNQPVSQSVDAGTTAQLNVTVVGTPPLYYQWRYNGVNLTDGGAISGSRAATLNIANVQANQAGNYSVVISNAVGSVTSTNIALSVTPIVPLSEGLDTPGWNYSTSGSPPWVGQTVVSHDGVDAARSGAIGNGSSAYFQTTVTGPASVSFWWRVSSETNNDRLFFSIGGTQQASISGEVPWQQRTYTVPSGSQALRWTYSKNSSTVAGQDRGWVDQIQFTSLAPTITNQPASTNVEAGARAVFNVGVVGTPPLFYQWVFNGTTIARATNATLTLTNLQPANSGNYSVLVSNAVGTASSSNAVLNVSPVYTLAEAVDTPTLFWTNGGTTGWVGQGLLTHDGIDAARSGAISGTGDSYFQTVLNGPGTLTWWWKVSSYSGNNYLRFYLDGSQKISISGEVGWEQRSFSISSGAHLVRFRYYKSSSTVRGSDRGWVDQVQFAPSVVPLPQVQNVVLQTQVHDNILTIRWPINPDRSYKVLYKDDLSATEWLEWPGTVIQSDSEMSIDIGFTENVQRFFRVVEY